MAAPTTSHEPRRDAPEWVFQWRLSMGSSLHKWTATLMVGGGFALFLTSSRIRVVPPMPWAARKATVIHVANDAEGRALTLQAREGGPFPSRFDLNAWDGAAAMERRAFADSRWSPPPYVPELRKLPDQPPPRVTLAATGQPTLPPLPAPAEAAMPPVKLRPTPDLYPLSASAAAALPRELPPFAPAVIAALPAEPIRFLVRLDAAGSVMDCVAMLGGDEAGPSPVEAWLRHVAFRPDAAKPSRWVVVDVGFTNQPADGPVTR